MSDIIKYLERAMAVARGEISDIPEPKPYKRKPTQGIYTPPDWKNIRDRTLKRDLWECRICHQNWSLHVHHIDYSRRNNDSSNLVTLCDTCHRAVHRENYKPSEHPDYPEPWGSHPEEE